MNFRQKKKGYLGDINITPLIDMMFILLIFLMISTTFKTPERAFSIKLPSAGNEEVTIVKGVPTVIVKSKGSYYFVGPEDSTPRQVTLDDLQKIFDDIAKKDPKTPVSIRSSKEASVQSLIDVISKAYQAGLTQVMLPYQITTSKSQK